MQNKTKTFYDNNILRVWKAVSSSYSSYQKRTVVLQPSTSWSSQLLPEYYIKAVVGSSRLTLQEKL